MSNIQKNYTHKNSMVFGAAFSPFFTDLVQAMEEQTVAELVDVEEGESVDSPSPTNSSSATVRAVDADSDYDSNFLDMDAVDSDF